MSEIHFSANTIGATKEIEHGGRRYLVSPVVALREGVLNGILVTAAEFSKYAASWSGRAVPINHPKDGNEYVSANSPDIWARDVPGHFWNVEVDGDKLKGEIWIDLAKAETIGARALGIVNRLRANQPVEVSTGYFADNEAVSGVWNGQPYTGIARHIRPDHLALLPDEVGACSWADGCGTPRVNSACGCKETQPMSEETPADVSANERNLFDKFLGWLGAGIPLGVKSPGATEPISIHEEVNMTKEQLIAGLVANAKCKFSKDKLQTWAEGDLQVLQDSLGGEEIPAALETSEEIPHSIHRPEPAISPELDARFAAIESLLKGLTANSDREKAEIISAIVTNSHGAWSEADLSRFDLPKLNQVYGSYQPRDYSANAGYVRTGTDPEEEELVMQWPVFEKKEG